MTKEGVRRGCGLGVGRLQRRHVERAPCEGGRWSQAAEAGKKNKNKQSQPTSS